MKFNKKIIFACIFIAILIPLYMQLKFLLMNESRSLGYRGTGIIFSFIVSVSIFSVNIKTIDFLRKKYPWDKQFIKRIIYEFLLTNFNASVIMTILIMLLYIIVPDFHNKKQSIVLFNTVVMAIIVNTIAVSFLEGYYFLKQWRISLVQAEKLKRENIQSQFEALKNQVDPHFLFNSLNTIYSLVDTHPDKAKEFITKFSKIYRYVLNVKENIVVKLSEELDFLRSYYFLQKIRYEENLEIIINIDARKIHYFIPPLSLQLLVENAIKHNIISEKKPLKIQITNNNVFLIIKNNLQAKENISESTNIGLNNLTERYKLISEITPKFYIKDNEYIAEIPLLKDE